MSQDRPIQTALAISAGAVPGAIGRFYIGEAVKAIWGANFADYSTFFVNILGCFIIAWVITAHEERFRHWPPEIRLALATGFCGAFTTFSTFGLETASFLAQGNGLLAIAYSAGSAIAGMVGILLGIAAARRA